MELHLVAGGIFCDSIAFVIDAVQQEEQDEVECDGN